MRFFALISLPFAIYAQTNVPLNGTTGIDGFVSFTCIPLLACPSIVSHSANVNISVAYSPPSRNETDASVSKPENLFPLTLNYILQVSTVSHRGPFKTIFQSRPVAWLDSYPDQYQISVSFQPEMQFIDDPKLTNESYYIRTSFILSIVDKTDSQRENLGTVSVFGPKFIVAANVSTPEVDPPTSTVSGPKATVKPKPTIVVLAASGASHLVAVLIIPVLLLASLLVI